MPPARGRHLSCSFRLNIMANLLQIVSFAPETITGILARNQHGALCDTSVITPVAATFLSDFTFAAGPARLINSYGEHAGQTVLCAGPGHTGQQGGAFGQRIRAGQTHVFLWCLMVSLCSAGPPVLMRRWSNEYAVADCPDGGPDRKKG